MLRMGLVWLMQTLPIFVYLIPFVMIFGPGKVPALLATLVFALPPVIRLTDLGIRHVDAEIVEAVTAFGATPRQKLFTAQLPLALPTIMAGINQTTMLALSGSHCFYDWGWWFRFSSVTKRYSARNWKRIIEWNSNCIFSYYI